MKSVLIASRNKMKIECFKSVFKELGIECETLSSIGYVPKVDECGSSHEINAIIKAVEPILTTDFITVADDGGIVFDGAKIVDPLKTHRYSGDLSKDIIKYLNNGATGPFGQSSRDRNCHFQGACAVAWKEHDQIKFNVLQTSSGDKRVRVMKLTTEEINDNTPIYNILQYRMEDGTDRRFSDLTTTHKMEITGALSAYHNIAYFIKDCLLAEGD